MEEDRVNTVIYGKFVISDRDKKLYEYAKQYNEECESYDETVCTGGKGMDGVLPADTYELALINKNAHKVVKRIMSEAVINGFSHREITEAIVNYSKNSSQ